MAGIRRCFDPFLKFGDGPVRRDHAQQRRLAGRARLHPAAARGRRALHHQPHADLRFGEAAAGTRAPADLPRIQLHDPAELRFPRAQPPPRRDAADGRIGPVGQHRRRGRTGAPHRRQAGVRPDHAADRHRVGRQDGQDGPGRRVARRQPGVAVRLLAVLAQHRGRRCRPLPAPVHRPAAGRDRAAGSARRRRDQRGEEDPGDRGDRAAARRRRGGRGRRNRASGVRGGRGG